MDWLFQDPHEENYFDDLLFNNEPQTCNTNSFTYSEQSWPSTSQEPAAKYLSSRDRQCDWPLDGATPTDRRLDIPKLGENRSSLPNRPCFSRASWITEDGRAKLQPSISCLLEKPLWSAISLANFPSKEKLDHCIDLFFANFRPVVSFIHQPTFDPTNAPVVLVLAMTSIGACFTNIDGAQAFAKATAELSRRMLLATEEQTTQLVKTEPYLTSQILLGIYGCSSGDRRLFSVGEAYRSTLIHNAKLTGLFHDTSQRMQSLVEWDSTAQWQAWIQHERRKRLAWAIYEFDALASILGNQRPVISTGDLTISLPEDTERWQASSASSWMSLRPSDFSEEDESIDFRNTMRSVFEPCVMETIRFTDVQHIHIIVVTLSRFLWSMKELQQGPIMDMGPERCLSSSIRRIS
ncbi:fungal-specific transcription factor domain-containing protein [Exophiala viscosa]|uniref:Fungal-specific transcription factor domain-containing protein n=1 Tax=Exophiala viscosa TaxID=2486360 RepID=A0AAN6DT14_9EURO|nr:fungal-specific transcription factor domain-containing protein [Exophiala viscosa]